VKSDIGIFGRTASALNGHFQSGRSAWIECRRGDDLMGGDPPISFLPGKQVL
jgi:hypothetical protein